MVKGCWVNNCPVQYSKGSSISFHNFPKDRKLRRKWVVASKRKNPSKSARLCSKHFHSTDFGPFVGRRRLKDDAVPSIFNIPQHHLRKENVPESVGRSIFIQCKIEGNNEMSNMPLTTKEETYDECEVTNMPLIIKEETYDECELTNMQLTIKEEVSTSTEENEIHRKRNTPMQFGDFEDKRLKYSIRTKMMYLMNKLKIVKEEN